MHSKMKKSFSEILKPTLVNLGFTRVELKYCIHYEELWRKGRLWFGISLDWRDQYLEVSLGHLYWFRDVMPRVIILGEYSSYANFDPYNKFKIDGLDKTLEALSTSLKPSLEVYKNHYSEILQSKLQPKKAKYAKEFILALGEEVSEEELKEYYA